MADEAQFTQGFYGVLAFETHTFTHTEISVWGCKTA